MFTVRVVTTVRGFLRDLFDYHQNQTFVYDRKQIYESKSSYVRKLSSLIKLPLFNGLGAFQVLTCNVAENIAFSYNRFLKCNKPYVLYLENPLAPLHYSIGRNKALLSKIRLKKIMQNRNLRYIVCLSKACENTLPLYYNITENVAVEQIYPLVCRRLRIKPDDIKTKSGRKELKCLYISASFELKGGQDILAAFGKIENENIKLTIITKPDSISIEDMKIISNNSNRIALLDFNLSKDQLGQFYSDSNILLNPSRQDSFPLVILEAMKYGNAILSTDIYAIKEMVKQGENGYLVRPKYEFWNQDNLPNKAVWNHRRKTIYSRYVDETVVAFLTDKIKLLDRDRDALEALSQASYMKAATPPFSEDYIYKKWKTLFKQINIQG